MNSELLNLSRLYLRSNHIFVYDSWLTECLQYLLTSHNNSNNLKEICPKVIEQWLLSDLTEISPGCLPHNLKNDNISDDDRLKMYTLQIKFISNFDYFYGYEYKQNTIRSKNEINRAGQHDLENRNLLLIMTDGMQEIFGRVLEPIKDLWINTVPGCKMLIKGLHFNKFNDLHFLILNDDNCELLGGEVDTLMGASYDYTVIQLNLLKIQIGEQPAATNNNNNKKRKNSNKSVGPDNKRTKTAAGDNNPDSAVTATDRHNGYVGQTSEQPAAKNKRSKSSNGSVGPDNGRTKMEADPDSAVTATDRHNGYVGQTSEQPAAKNKRSKSSNGSVGPDNRRTKMEAGNNNPDSAVTATDRHNGYVGQTIEQPAAKNKRSKSSNGSVGPDNRRTKMEAGNNSPDWDVTVTYVGQTSEQPAAKNKRRRSSNRSVVPDNRRIKMEAVHNSVYNTVDLTRGKPAVNNNYGANSVYNIVDLTGQKPAVNNNYGANGFIDLTRNGYVSGGSRRPTESVTIDLTNYEQQYPDISFTVKRTK